MPTLSPELQNLVLDLVDETADQSERRRYPRNHYPVRQRIALWRHGCTLSQSDFFDVVCDDLSQGGFSFYSVRFPETSQIVAELGLAPEWTYLLAAVLKVCEAWVSPSGKIDFTASADEDGLGAKKIYLVRCRFLRKLSQLAMD